MSFQRALVTSSIPQGIQGCQVFQGIFLYLFPQPLYKCYNVHNPLCTTEHNALVPISPLCSTIHNAPTPLCSTVHNAHGIHGNNGIWQLSTYGNIIKGGWPHVPRDRVAAGKVQGLYPPHLATLPLRAMHHAPRPLVYGYMAPAPRHTASGHRCMVQWCTGTDRDGGWRRGQGL